MTFFEEKFTDISVLLDIFECLASLKAIQRSKYS